MKIIRHVFVFLSIAFITFLIYGYVFHKNADRIPPRLSISEVTYGTFVQSIPANGKINSDSLVDVELDQMYFEKIKVGLHATSEINAKIYRLRIHEIDTTLLNGRFRVKVSFRDSIPSRSEIRLRIQLSDSINAVQLPVGGFYSDTRGKWILVIEGDTLTRRNITLGRHSPDYFEILDGLNPGDRVITSSYQNYISLFDDANIILVKDLPKDVID
jgi:hypothetical protein